MVFRDNEMSEATASRLLTAKLNIAAARRSQSPTTSAEIRQKNADRQRRKANQR